MTDRISRRTLLSSAVLLVPTIIAPHLPLDPTEPWTKRTASEPEAKAEAKAAVATMRSYGPNGTHWPANTPSSARASAASSTWRATGRRSARPSRP